MRLLESFVENIRSAIIHNRDIQAEPACILWPDAERQWQSAIPMLLGAMPELFILGDYEPQKRQGPAIWLRCVLAGRIAQIPSPPVFYLPGVGRSELRAVDNCPAPLRPLAPLQYSGAFFSQLNSRDWTILAWLVSAEGGLGLDAARDAASKKAMRLALPRLLQEDAEDLRGKTLDSDFFNTLLTGGDAVRELLQWLDDEKAFRAARSENEWRAFVDLCKSRFSFDPENDGLLSAAENLARHAGAWQPVWERFCESWSRFPNIGSQIYKCSPPEREPGWRLAEPAYAGWPQWNDAQENGLRQELAALANEPPHICAQKLLELEKIHAARMDSPWAEMGRAPLALALGPLARLAANCQAFTAADIAKSYAQIGWQTDDAALRAMACCGEKADEEVMEAILRNLYLPWLDDCARFTQQYFENRPYPAAPCAPNACWSDGDCLLFVDGLRFDAAKNLSAMLSERGMKPLEQIYWAPLPSLTATAKPAVSPVCDLVAGSAENVDFEPEIASSGRPVKGNLERLLAGAGWEVLKNGDPGSGKGRAWAEFGSIDQEGHHQGVKLAANLEGLLREIAKYIEELLGAGWKKIVVITDHGWLWLPGGLPKSNLPADLVVNKWGRCAIPKEGSIIRASKFPWYWNENRYFALADGASCYKSGQVYAHGGLSPQECILLKITVEAESASCGLTLLHAKWSGLRCNIAVEGEFAQIRADIRLEPANPESSVAISPKAFKENGAISLFVNDEDENREAHVVLLDADGKIVLQAKTIIGGDADGNGRPG